MIKTLVLELNKLEIAKWGCSSSHLLKGVAEFP